MSSDQKKQDIEICLRLLQWDYADGKGDWGPVLEKFTGILNKYQKLFLAYKPYTAPHALERAELGERFIPRLKALVIFLVWTLLTGFLAHSPVTLAICCLIGGGIIAFAEKDMVWFMIEVGVGCLVCILMFVDAGNVYLPASLILAACYVLKTLKQQLLDIRRRKWIDKQQASALQEYQTNKKALDSYYETLKRMTPSLKQEYVEMRTKLLAEEGLSLEDDPDGYWGMPEIFWWEIPVESLENVENLLEKSRRSARETSWVHRKQPGKEFTDAGSEFSPLENRIEDIDLQKTIYDATKQKIFGENIGVVIDFITRIGSASAHDHTETYMDYKYSDSYRASKELAFTAACGSIDKAYEEGRITQNDRDELARFAFYKGLELREKLDEKVEYEKTVTNIKRDFVNVWTGQMLLVEDDVPGGFAISDYRCRLSHLYENLECVSNIKITRILGNPVTRDPVVVAKLHRVCAECR